MHDPGPGRVRVAHFDHVAGPVSGSVDDEAGDDSGHEHGVDHVGLRCKKLINPAPKAKASLIIIFSLYLPLISLAITILAHDN